MRKKLLLIIAFIPMPAAFRGRLYKLMYGANIGKNFKIGYGSYLDSKSINVGNNCSVGNMVRVKFLDELSIGDNSSVGSSSIVCGAYNSLKYKDRNFYIGKDSNILCSHYFDVVAPIYIGDHVTIAGKWTQIYTHSFDLCENRLDGSVFIDDHVYIGAGCLINLGVKICSFTVIQGGTIVSKSITESGVYSNNHLERRGNVREYYELYSDKDMIELDDGHNAYYKE